VQISAQILHEMMNHALEAQPDECCGLIVGHDGERFRQAIRCHNEMTARHHEDPARYPRDSRSAFYMSHRDVEEVSRVAELAGERVTAIYHSHVGAGAYLSEMDLEYAESPVFPFPEADWIVLPVFDRRVHEVALFRRAPGGFQGRVLVGVPS
jgi:proteasome lid subunit RPN8/RPN11